MSPSRKPPEEHSGPKLCEERDRLTNLYLAAIKKNAEDGKAIEDKKSAEWRDATRAARAACVEALAALNEHRNDHGC